jgi:hypothetical protein
MTAAASAITAAWINSDSAILTISGTSMPPPPLPTSSPSAPRCARKPATRPASCTTPTRAPLPPAW